MQVLTQVLHLLQNLLLEVQAKEHLQVSLRGLYDPRLQTRKSTAELIVEKRDVAHATNLFFAQEEMNVIGEGVAVWEGELQALRAALLQPPHPKLEHVQLPPRRVWSTRRSLLPVWLQESWTGHCAAVQNHVPQCFRATTHPEPDDNNVRGTGRGLGLGHSAIRTCPTARVNPVQVPPNTSGRKNRQEGQTPPVT